MTPRPRTSDWAGPWKLSVGQSSRLSREFLLFLEPSTTFDDVLAALRRQTATRPADAAIFISVLFSGRTQAEIAEEHGVTQPTISKTVTRVAGAVRKDLEGGTT